MPDYSEGDLVNVPYDCILDRSELQTRFAFKTAGPVWLPNAEIQDIRDLEQEVRIPKWLAQEKGLI